MRIAFYTVTILTCVCIVTYFSLMHWYSNSLQRRLIDLFAKQLHCTAQATIDELHFFFPKVRFKEVTVHPAQDHTDKLWSWEAAEIVATFSWIDLFLYRAFLLSVDVYGWKGNSNVIGDKIPLLNHLAQLTSLPPVSIPATIQRIQFHHAASLFETEIFKIASAWNCIFSKKSEQFDALFTLYEMTVHRQQKLLCEQGKLHARISFAENDFWKSSGTMQGVFMLTHLQELCALKGNFDGSAGRFSVTTSNQNFFLDPIIVTQPTVQISGRLPVQLLNAITDEEHINGVTGLVSGKLLFDRLTSSGKGNLFIEEIKWNDTPVCSWTKITVKGDMAAISGSVTARVKEAELVGSGDFNFQTRCGHVLVENTTMVRIPQLPYFTIEQGKLRFLIEKNSNLMNALFKSEIRNTIHNKLEVIQLSAISNDFSNMTLSGTCNDIRISGSCSIENRSLVTSEMTITNPEQKRLCSIATKQEIGQSGQVIQCMIENRFFASCIESIINKPILHGPGTYKIDGIFTNPIFTGTGILEAGAITIPYSDNFLLDGSMNFSFDIENRCALLSKMSAHCGLSAISIESGMLAYNDAGRVVTYKIPVKIDRYAWLIPQAGRGVVSTDLLFSYEESEKKNTISGTILLHEGEWNNEEIAQNLAQSTIQVNLLNNNHLISSALDVSCTTEDPFIIDTVHVKTNAHVKLWCAGTVTQPKITGCITAHGGELRFPYKSLYISHGRVLFSGGGMHDAILEVHAKNSIKNYSVSLNIAGPMKHYYFSLDATPYLAQSQIFSLLFFGSPQENLTILLPSFMKIKLGSLYVQVMPGFADKTSRGGIRGAIEIAVNNRLRALIQKNFTLSEDTRFELEYAVTDTVTIRGIRDERRDIGAEIEMRLKF